MGVPETNFDGVADDFGEYGEQVRGYVRYALVKRNLEPYLTGDPLDIVDVGGGSAIDASWIAELGHSVTIVEPSGDQIEKAHERVAVLPSEVQDRITIVYGSAENLLSAGEAGKYDMALSHGVAMYVKDPEGFVGSLAELIRVGGYISLLEKGYAGSEARLIRQGQIEQLLTLQATKKLINNMKREVHAFSPEDIIGMMAKADIHVLEWSGVRVITDHDTRSVDSLSPAEIKAIVDTEYEQGHNPGIRALGQMLHFIARKPD